MNVNAKLLLRSSFVVALFCMGACKPNPAPKEYLGIPYSDSIYKEEPQKIPGKIQCEYYDFGGEGIAFHDSDSTNWGSGQQNSSDGSYFKEFRKNEAVDISYTRFEDNPQVDNNSYNFVEPEPNQLYIGWTSPGEWTKYTVDVQAEGLYELGLMYTSNQNGKISISLNDEDKTGPLLLPSTFVAADTVAWRQWHHWNYVSNVAQMQMKKGIQTITIFTAEIGQMNYDYIDFKLIEE